MTILSTTFQVQAKLLVNIFLLGIFVFLNMLSHKYLLGLATHLFCWVVFLCLPLMLLPLPIRLVAHQHIYDVYDVLSAMVSIGFFYFQYSWAISQLYFMKKTLFYVFITLVIVLGIILFFRLLMFLHHIQLQEIEEQPFGLLRNLIAKLLIVFVIAWLVRLYEQNKQQETAKNMAELAYLRGQIHPHFLFNTLNGIYALAMKKSDQTADSIAQLADLLRYSLVEAQADKVSMITEVIFIENYITLQQLRLTAHTQVIFEVEGKIPDKKIVPLLLITFVENAFKYGVNSETESRIFIQMLFNGNELSLTVQNDKVAKQVISQGIGLQNTTQQLLLHYPHKHHLTLKNTNQNYTVQLIIQLT